MSIVNAAVGSRYQLRDRLGAGSMGEVFRALDRLTGKIVALKRVTVPHAQLEFGARATQDDSSAVQLALAQEFRTLSTLRHPHIISVLDYSFDDERQPFFTMDLVENAVDLLAASRDQLLTTQVDLLIQLLQALAYLHRRGILHRDLKPANVLVAHGQVKVLDFGLSANAELAPGRQGTLAYMAPEVLKQAAIGPPADLHAVGIMAYQMLTGDYPFSTASPTQLPGSILYQQPDITPIQPARLAEVVARLLAKAPADRYATAGDAIVAFSEAIDRVPPAESVTIRESFLQAAQFVGRESEFAQLHAALNDVIDGARAAWLIGGESGVGKSRLVDELRTLALFNGVLVLRGQAVEVSGGRPYELWRNVLPHLALSTELSDLEAGIFKAIVPDIDRLVGRTIAGVPALNAADQQERLALAVREVLARQPRPILLILEDLQWTGESLGLLQHIFMTCERLAGVMIVGTYRDDERPGLPEDLPVMRLLSLGRLSEQHIAELSAIMIGSTGQSPEVVQFLADETEGNLFFLVETVRALAEMAGSLAQIGQTTLPESVFVGGVQQIVRRRLGKVDARFHAPQTLAAVLGRDIDPVVLQAALPLGLIDDWLNSAAEAAVLDWQSDRWRFAHDKLRAAVRQDIPDDERPQWHRQAAEALETVYPDNEAFYGMLLEHWHQVGDLDKILFYAEKAAEFTLNTVGDYDLVRRIVTRAVRNLAPDDNRQSRLLLWQAQACHFQSSLAEAEAILDRVRALADANHDDEILAGSLHILGSIKNTQARYDEAQDYLQQSIALHRALDDLSGVGIVLGTLGTTAFYKGDYAEAEVCHQQGLGLAREQNSQHAVSVCLNNLGNIVLGQGRLAEAQDIFEQSVAVAREIGHIRLQGIGLTNLGTVFNEMDQPVQAQMYYEQAYALNQKAGTKEQQAFNLLGLGEAAERQHKLAEALDYYDQGRALAETLGAQYQLSLAYVCLGGVQHKLTMADAEISLVKSLTIAHEIKATRVMLITILRIVQLMNEAVDARRAAEWVGLVQQHPVFEPSFQQDLEQALANLREVLDGDVLSAALARGAALRLGPIAEEILAALGTR